MTTRPRQRAITIVNEALEIFEARTGLDPLVILLPTILFDRLAAERQLIDSVTPDTLKPYYSEANRAGEFDLEVGSRAGRWINVRVVESPRAGLEIEVY